MRSLWRMMAARWLGGHASHGLNGDAALLDLLMPADPLLTAGFQVRRTSGVSHRAMMSRHQTEPEPTAALGRVSETDRET
jgi:hypothetical protein